MVGREPTREAIFQTCLAALEAGEDLEAVLGRYPKLAPFLRPELEAFVWLRTRQAWVKSRPGFLPASRRRLVERLQAGKTARPQPWLAAAGRFVRWPWSFRMVAQAAVLIVFVFSLLSVYGDAADSARIALPGDTFYPMKIFGERLRLAVTYNRFERARLDIAYSQERGYELQGLILEGRIENLSSVVVAYIHQIYRTRQDLAEINAIDPQRASVLNMQWQQTFTNQSYVLPVLIGMLPVEVRSGVQPVMMLAH